MDTASVPDRSSNELWINADNYDDWETSRPVIFRDDMRETFFKWFRIKSGDCVLDGGCATGVLTRFIAEGLTCGSVTGFDLSRSFVKYGNDRILEKGLSDKAKIVWEDGFSLSFADNTFDSVVNHAYLGVLSDVPAGLRELIRVCKPGGHISASVPSRGFPGIHWAGDSPFEHETRLNELKGNNERIYRMIMTSVALKQDEYWNAYRYPRLFAKCGLKDITIHPYASGFSYNDSYWSDEFKEYLIEKGIGREIDILKKQKADPRFAVLGFSECEFDELISLYGEKQKYLLSSINNNDCWEWNANMLYIVTGTKQ